MAVYYNFFLNSDQAMGFSQRWLARLRAARTIAQSSRSSIELPAVRFGWGRSDFEVGGALVGRMLVVAIVVRFPRDMQCTPFVKPSTITSVNDPAITAEQGMRLITGMLAAKNRIHQTLGNSAFLWVPNIAKP